MAKFEIGRAVKTTEPAIMVDAGLPLGRHRFQLQVHTTDGRRSHPDVVEVVVERMILRPTDIGPLRPPVTPEVNSPTVDPVVPGPVIDRRTPIRRTPRRKK